MVRPTDDFLTVWEVAKILHVHVSTVRRWNKDGILKAYRIGPRGERRISRREIARFLGLFSIR